MTPKVTFRNDTKEEISFLHEFKNVKGDKFTVKPGQVHEVKMTVSQTHETFWLLNSAGKKTDKQFDTDDLTDFQGVTVTKEGDEYILTKVQRTNLWNWLQSIVHQIPKLLKGKDETLPTRQKSSSSQLT